MMIRSSMTITRMTSGSWGRVRAFFDVKVEGITIKGFKLVESKEGGFFVGNPNYKGNDGEYHDSVFIESEDRKELLKLAEKKYFAESPDSKGAYDDGVPMPVKEKVEEEIPF